MVQVSAGQRYSLHVQCWGSQSGKRLLGGSQSGKCSRWTVATCAGCWLIVACLQNHTVRKWQVSDKVAFGGRPKFKGLLLLTSPRSQDVLKPHCFVVAKSINIEVMIRDLYIIWEDPLTIARFRRLLGEFL